MAAQGGTLYDWIASEGPARKEPATTIRMSTFGSSNDTNLTEYTQSSGPPREPGFPRRDSNTSSEDFTPAPRFASWKKNPFARKDRPRSASWRPFTFKPGFLVPLLLVTIALIVILELINRKGIRDGGIFFANSMAHFDKWEIFCYQYLPTILAVLYGMIWAVLDLDVKRLEPYFQLSKLEGVSGKDSIMLSYPFEFLAYVPIASFRRRHWTVFLSGFALVVTFWIITPLQSAILATQIKTRKIPASFILSKALAPFEQQRTVLTSQFEYAAYGVAWLGEEVAPFITRGYAAVPFRPLDGDSEHVKTGGNESWTAKTRVYSTKVDCKPAANINYTSFDEWGDMWYLTDDLNTCTVGVIPIDSGTRNLEYFGGPNKGIGSRFTHSGCNDTNLFVGVWAQASNDNTPPEDQDINAIFCRTSYFYADTVVSVDGTTLRVSSPQAIEPSAGSTSIKQKDNIIDIERIEMDMLNIAQMSPGPGDPYIYRIGPSSTLRFDNWNLSEPSRMIGYVIASGDNASFEDFKDPGVFGKAVEKAHQLLFANALGYLLQPIPEAKVNKAVPVAGMREARGTAVVVVSELVHALEGCLAFVGLCIVGLLITHHHRRNNLFSDPDSLAAKMALVADSKPLLDDFEGLDDCPEPQKCIPNRRYRLDVWADGSEHYRLDRVHLHSEDIQKIYNEKHVPQHTGAGVMPLELRLWVGIALTVTFSGLLVFLCVLYKSSLKYYGLPTLSNSQIGVQIIFSFIPTIIATIIEPLWVVITRSICAYQPYVELHKGNASASSALGAKFTNLPAALVLPRALRSGNFLISSLSAITLLANLLAVTLSGLFENVYIPIPKPDIFTQALEPLVHTQMQYGEEQYLLANTNITAGTALPPFVSSEFYFLPFNWDETEEKNSSDLHTAVTRGFGGNVTCQPLETESFHLTYYTPVRIEAGSERNAPDRYWANNFNVTVPKTGEAGTINCTAYPASDPNQKIFWTKNLAAPGNLAAGEYMLDLEPTAPNADQDTWDECLSILILGWVRGTISYSNHGDYNFSFVPDTFKSTNLLCQQKVYSAYFEVVVDGSKRVQSYHRVSPFDDNSQVYFQNNSLTNFTAQMGRFFMAGSSVGGTNDDLYNIKAVDASMDEAKFHNDSTAVLFPHGLIGTLLNNTKLADPAAPVPDFDLVSRGFQDLYRRLFAISLSLNSDRIFTHGAGNHSIIGTTTTDSKRISMSRAMFFITAILLAINAMIAITTWILRPKRFLPRFPDNLAAEIGFFYASQALRDVSGTVSMSSRAREKHLEGLGYKYGYGVYIAEDGKRHRGVERQSILSRNDEYNTYLSRL